ncbi:MAG: hypothetical protein PHP45_02450 [Elusimicrobiales bacterium]|nr:hypothetical protein [Elusimicrobiales bacterium]
MEETRKLFFVISAILLAAPAYSDDAFHHHQFKAGEIIRYNYEDTDTIFPAVRQDDTIQAGDGMLVQEIQIPVEIMLQQTQEGLERKLTISPLVQYRQSQPATLAQISFKAVADLSKNFSNSFSYSYKDDTDALNRLQTIFETVRKDDVGQFLFFKIQDIHQMQESTEHIPEGMVPGATYFSARHERKGFGGDFVAAPAQWIYQGTEVLDGIKCGYFKIISMGIQFALPKMKTYTNFFFTLHVALEGPQRGLVILGEGQETATVLHPTAEGTFESQAILQRQFSIRLRN